MNKNSNVYPDRFTILLERAAAIERELNHVISEGGFEAIKRASRLRSQLSRDFVSTVSMASGDKVFSLQEEVLGIYEKKLGALLRRTPARK